MMFKKGDIPRNESGLRYLRRTHGTDSKVWAENSPARRAGEVNIPVYLAAGARDERTPPEQTELMQEALVEAGNPPEGMIIQSGEMHGYYDEENRLNLYTKMRSEEHTSELQSLMRISYAVFCLKKKKNKRQIKQRTVT